MVIHLQVLISHVGTVVKIICAIQISPPWTRISKLIARIGFQNIQNEQVIAASELKVCYNGHGETQMSSIWKVLEG